MQILLALFAGLGLGWFYFGGLWITVQHIPSNRQPLTLILLSFGLRLGIVLLGGYLVMSSLAGQLMILPMLVCAAGFLLARTVLISRISRQI